MSNDHSWLTPNTSNSWIQSTKQQSKSFIRPFSLSNRHFRPRDPFYTRQRAMRTPSPTVWFLSWWFWKTPRKLSHVGIPTDWWFCLLCDVTGIELKCRIEWTWDPRARIRSLRLWYWGMVGLGRVAWWIGSSRISSMSILFTRSV